MIDYHIFKSMLNRYFSRHAGGNNRPDFFDIDQTFPELNILTENFATIQREFLNAAVQQKDLPLYHEVDPGEAEISNTTDKKWSVFMFYLMGYSSKENCALCPETYRLLKKIPNMMQAFFSILEPGKSIPLHEGPYLGYLRYHLGLQVPKDNPPSIWVNSKQYTWETGKAVLFDDSYPHRVVNNSTETRAVLIVDVLRPMPFLPTCVNKFMTNILAKYLYGRKVMQRATEAHLLTR